MRRIIGLLMAVALVSACTGSAQPSTRSVQSPAPSSAPSSALASAQSSAPSLAPSPTPSPSPHHLFFPSSSTTIGRANLDGSGVDQHFITSVDGPTFPLVAGSYLYWGSTGWIGRATLDGAEVNQHFINTGAYRVDGLATDGTYLYWADTSTRTGTNDGTAIGRANLDGSGVDQHFISGAHGPTGLATDGMYLYWANTDPGYAGSTIGRA